MVNLGEQKRGRRSKKRPGNVLKASTCYTSKLIKERKNGTSLLQTMRVKWIMQDSKEHSSGTQNLICGYTWRCFQTRRQGTGAG